MKVAVVGATGLVGTKMLQVLSYWYPGMLTSVDSTNQETRDVIYMPVPFDRVP